MSGHDEACAKGWQARDYAVSLGRSWGRPYYCDGFKDGQAWNEVRIVELEGEMRDAETCPCAACRRFQQARIDEDLAHADACRAALEQQP